MYFIRSVTGHKLPLIVSSCLIFILLLLFSPGRAESRDHLETNNNVHSPDKSSLELSEAKSEAAKDTSPPFDSAPNEVPNQPTGVTTRTIANTIVVNWNQPEGPQRVQGYLVGWGKNVPDTETVTVDRETFSVTLTNLEPQSEYVITVRAYNQMGQGVPAYVADITGKPIRVKAFTLSSSSVNLEWTVESASQSRQLNQSYSVRFGPRMSPSQYKQIETNSTSVLIDKLEPSTSYEFAVKTVGGAQSDWSDPVFNTTFPLEPLGPPMDLVVSSDFQVVPSHVHLEWKPPKGPTGRIEGFQIFYTTNATRPEDSWLIQMVPENTSSALLSNLQSDTKYYFKIRAIDQNKKSGPFSSTVSFRTNPKTISIVISTETFYFAMAGCVAFVVILLLICLTCSRCCKSKRPDVECTSGKSSGKNKRSETRQVNPPDLWIHHDQFDSKTVEKDHQGEGSRSPVLSTFHEPIQLETSHLEKCQGVLSYPGDAVCGDPCIGSASESACFAATGRSSVKSIVIPVTSSTAGGQFNSVAVTSSGCGLTTLFEPTTGLSLPVYAKSDSLASNLLPLHSGFQPVICNSIQLPYPQPKLNCGHNVPSHPSSGTTSSCAMSPTDASSSGISSTLTTSASINNLTLRALPGLRSFMTLDSYPRPSANTPKHIVVKPQANT